MEVNFDITDQVARALAEDIGDGDISARLIDPGQQLNTQLLVREDAILCGQSWFEQAFLQCDESIQIEWKANDGDRIAANTVVCEVSGPARALLTAERTALNYLQTLSATATRTRHYVDLIGPGNCKILDTRKTIPHFRRAQKYAVTCGGGVNHRTGLFDAYLIKENHLAACGSIAKAVARGRQLEPDKLLEVEVENLHQLGQAIEAGVDRVLLDNFSLEMLKQAVELNQHRVELEASGNITDTTLPKIARTGVNFISVGALTKHVQAIDFSLRYI
ncbi:MAG: nicotinate-nucleotide pyrophosphorylase (carboxylating) [Planctomycetota bacterium]|jgi:nicotinate-nucleotide pyrophosphorylase (carboxylating)